MVVIIFERNEASSLRNEASSLSRNIKLMVPSKLRNDKDNTVPSAEGQAVTIISILKSK